MDCVPSHFVPAQTAALSRGRPFRILISYHYFKNVDIDALMKKHFVDPYPEVFLDSGAWSAFTCGVPISMSEYQAFIRRFGHWFSVYVNLDDMRSPENTYRSHQIMKDAGFNPLPAFHTGEDFRHLVLLPERRPPLRDLRFLCPKIQRPGRLRPFPGRNQPMKTYLVNEIYLTLHGEGVRYGIPHVFVRFAKCNLTCGFCDTEFESYQKLTGEQILSTIQNLAEGAAGPAPDEKIDGQTLKGGSPIGYGPTRNVMLCGGEPLLQVDEELVSLLKAAGWFIALETNGTKKPPDGIDWIACSPKVAEHAVALDFAHELKYVRAAGQGIPHPKAKADHYLISPMFDGDSVPPETLAWCIRLVQENPGWRLTVQHHKVGFGGLR